MTEESRVLIRHKEDGREFSVTLQDYKRVKHADGQTYAEQGFEQPRPTGAAETSTSGGAAAP
jgi:hypothetical protein